MAVHGQGVLTVRPTARWGGIWSRFRIVSYAGGPVDPRAASARTSVSVGWAWTDRAISSAAPPPGAQGGSANRSRHADRDMRAEQPAGLLSPRISRTRLRHPDGALPSARNELPTLTPPPAGRIRLAEPHAGDLGPAERDARHEVHSDRLASSPAMVSTATIAFVTATWATRNRGPRHRGVQVLDAGAIWSSTITKPHPSACRRSAPARCFR